MMFKTRPEASSNEDLNYSASALLDLKLSNNSVSTDSRSKGNYMDLPVEG